MAGARHLEHHSGQPMPHEVVDVSRDPPPLGEQRLLGQLAPRRLELCRHLPVAREGAADDPGEDGAHDPVGDADLGRVQGHGHRHGCGHREQSQRYCRRPRLRPAGNDEGKDGQLEEKRLELSGSLCGGHRDDDGEGERREGHSGQVGPQAEGDDR